MKSVCVVILNYNNLRATEECIDSVLSIDDAGYSIVVVDNSSSDGSAEILKERYPQVTLLINDSNLGYSAGNNVGIDYALEQKADYVWLLNNDTIVDPLSLSELRKEAGKHRKIGILGSKILFYDRPDRINFAGGNVSLWKGHEGHMDYDSLDSGVREPGFEVDYVNGASMLIKSEMIEEIGTLDPSYFFYYEEVDYAVRARKAGWKVMYVPSSRVCHKIKDTFGQENPLGNYYLFRNRLIFFKRHYPLFLPLALLYILYSNVIKTIAKIVLWGFPESERTNLKVTLKAIRDFFLGLTGEIGNPDSS